MVISFITSLVYHAWYARNDSTRILCWSTTNSRIGKLYAAIFDRVFTASSKACHLKSFGTRNLRHANLPLAAPPEDGAPPRAISPTSSSPTKAAFSAQALLRPINTGGGAPLPRVRPRSLISPISPNFTGTGRNQSPVRQSFSQLTGRSSSGSNTPNAPSTNGDTISEENEEETQPEEPTSPIDPTSANEQSETPQNESLPDPATSSEPTTDAQSATPVIPSHTGRPGLGTLPRTIPLFLNPNGSVTPFRQHGTSQSLGSIPASSIPSSTYASTLLSSSESDAAPSHDTPPAQLPGSESPSTAEVEDAPPDSDSKPSSIPPSQIRATNRTPDSQGRNSPTGAPGHRTAFSLGSVNVTPTYTGGNFSPLVPTATGTRYGSFLSGGQRNVGSGGVSVNMTGTPGGTPRRQWGAGTPSCGRCGKSVYFAEQIKAVGKTFHKACLRCAECGTSLDSNKLRDHDGDPYCVRCYNKNYGPQGGGYALLGKAGG
ncbi:hypothetical protein CVT24_002232 [Panaeolus cyanescens]|uniref:LIM zinc-binding domain-containing protein n=1 Tax=Panaeolus cyanescens TaxID=181874 RepID=A0A409YIP3_9AGAR|nr:hypothetical protein CVT24_002232 [Panaeolus cyanescens]